MSRTTEHADAIGDNTARWLAGKMSDAAWKAEQRRLWDAVPPELVEGVCRILVPFGARAQMAMEGKPSTEARADAERVSEARRKESDALQGLVNAAGERLKLYRASLTEVLDWLGELVTDDADELGDQEERILARARSLLAGEIGVPATVTPAVTDGPAWPIESDGSRYDSAQEMADELNNHILYGWFTDAVGKEWKAVASIKVIPAEVESAEPDARRTLEG